jgi:hypothetical protein
MLAIGMLAAAAGLVLGLRFSLMTLLLLTLAIVITFATSVLGGSGSLAVGLQTLATLAPNQLSRRLLACGTSSRAGESGRGVQIDQSKNDPERQHLISATDGI